MKCIHNSITCYQIGFTPANCFHCFSYGVQNVYQCFQMWDICDDKCKCIKVFFIAFLIFRNYCIIPNMLFHLVRTSRIILFIEFFIYIFLESSISEKNFFEHFDYFPYVVNSFIIILCNKENNSIYTKNYSSALFFNSTFLNDFRPINKSKE